MEARGLGSPAGMDVTRTLSAGLAVSRILVGANYLVRPVAARSSWIGRAAKKPGAQVMVRSQGARDVALGLGALRALFGGRPGEARAWMAAHALADAADTGATLVALDDLPKRRGRAVLAVAAASTAIGLLGAAAPQRARS